MQIPKRDMEAFQSTGKLILSLNSIESAMNSAARKHINIHINNNHLPVMCT